MQVACLRPPYPLASMLLTLNKVLASAAYDVSKCTAFSCSLPLCTLLPMMARVLYAYIVLYRCLIPWYS